MMTKQKTLFLILLSGLLCSESRFRGHRTVWPMWVSQHPGQVTSDTTIDSDKLGILSLLDRKYDSLGGVLPMQFARKRLKTRSVCVLTSVRGAFGKNAGYFRGS